jgi:hypothetical protein
MSREWDIQRQLQHRRRGGVGRAQLEDADFVWLNYALDLPNISLLISISYENTEPGFPMECT